MIFKIGFVKEEFPKKIRRKNLKGAGGRSAPRPPGQLRLIEPDN